MNEIRQEKINTYIQKHEVVTIKELQEMFPQVTLMTIHRDLDALSAAGYITKVRGGARSIHHAQDPELKVREQENLAGKTKVAEKAVGLVHSGSCIFMDAGTSCLAVARIMPDSHTTIITTGPSIAIALSKLTKPSVNLCPGTLNKENLTVSGYSTLEYLDKLNIDLAFIGVSGCSKDSGFTCGNESEMMVKQKVIQKARTSAVLCDRTKLTRLMPFTFAKLEDVDFIISDDGLPKSFYQTAEETGVKVL